MRRLALAALASAVLLCSMAHPAAQTSAVQKPDNAPRSPDVVFVPTPPQVVEAMLKTANVSSKDLVYDLGCGDGRIVIAAAKQFGARGVGVDIDPVRIQEARANAQAAGVADRIKFIQRDLFETNLRPATVVTLYLLESLNLKAAAQARDGAEARHAHRVARVQHGTVDAGQGAHSRRAARVSVDDSVRRAGPTGTTGRKPR